MKSLEGLLANTGRAVRIRQLVKIARDTESPEKADSEARQLEFPLTFARETRLLATIKRDHPKEFWARIDQWLKQASDVKERVFSCELGPRSTGELVALGELSFRPNPFLPPIFWDFELRDDEESLFSSDREKPLSEEARIVGIFCTLTDSSSSLPVDLLVDLWRNNFGERVVTFKRRFEDGYEIHWTRIIPEKEDGERYKRVVVKYNKPELRPCEEAVFKKLDPKERNLLGIEEPDVFCLSLLSRVGYVVFLEGMGTKKLVFSIKTFYQFSNLFHEGARRCDRAYEGSDPRWLRSGFPLMIVPELCESLSHIETTECALQEELWRIFASCSPIIDGGATLWKLFGFRSESTSIYNTDFATMLVPPSKS